MASAGPANWRAVTTDHIGVPHGGLYGDVRKWEPKLKKAGLLLCWCTIQDVFGIYTALPDGKYVFQMSLKHRDGGPIPIDEHLVRTLVFLRESHHRQDRSLLEQEAAQRKAQMQAKIQADLAEERSDRARRATDIAFMGLGVKPKKVMIELGKGVN